MIARRQLIGGGLVGSLFGEGGGQPASDKAALEEIASSVRELRRGFDAQQDFHEIGPVRARITEYLRAQMKFPDYLDIGTDLWWTVYDWHVRNVQPLALNRDAQGRYTMQFVATTLVLRPDLVPNYLGTPYDNR